MFISLRFVAPSSKPCEIATWDSEEPRWSVIQLLGWHVQDLAAAFAMLRPSLDSTSPRRHAPRSGHWCENLMGNAWKVHTWRLFPFPLLQSCGNKPNKQRWNKDETKMKQRWNKDDNINITTKSIALWWNPWSWQTMWKIVGSGPSPPLSPRDLGQGEGHWHVRKSPRRGGPLSSLRLVTSSRRNVNNLFDIQLGTCFVDLHNTCIVYVFSQF